MLKEKIKNIILNKYNNKINKANIKSFITTIQHQYKSEIEKYIILNDTSFSEKIYIILYGIKYCKTCGKKSVYYSFINGYGDFCSRKCIKYEDNIKKIRTNKVKQTKLERYGSENYCNVEKIKQTKLEHFGDENYNNREKVKQTNLELHGIEFYVNQEKKKQTNLKLYGFEYAQLNQLVKDKQKRTTFNRYYNKLLTSDRLKGLVKPLFNIEDYKGNDWNIKYSWQCIKCNTIFEDNVSDGRIPRCPKCFPIHINKSKYELEISDWLSLLNINNICNSKSIISPLELDIYLPDYNIAIEFNGLYWHSELQGKDKNYHLNKTNLCKEKEIQLIHIWDIEWIEKQEIVKSIILSKLGIYNEKIMARKCIIKELKYSDISTFLFDNHIQGTIKSSINIGLFYKNDLIAVSSFNKTRYRKDDSYELLRFCSKLNTQVLGGLSKLISYFKKNHSENIISYCDKRYSIGKGYISSGFKIIGESTSNYWYFNKKEYKLKSRIQFQKHKLEKLFPGNYDKSLTEWQNMQINGYDRIWDCGNYVCSI